MAESSKKSGPIEMTPEFRKWLRSKNVKRKERRNPEVLQSYYREWLDLTNPKKARRRKPLLNLSRINLHEISSNLQMATEIVNTIQGIKEIWKPNKHQE